MLEFIHRLPWRVLPSILAVISLGPSTLVRAEDEKALREEAYAFRDKARQWGDDAQSMDEPQRLKASLVLDDELAALEKRAAAYPDLRKYILSLRSAPVLSWRDRTDSMRLDFSRPRDAPGLLEAEMRWRDFLELREAAKKGLYPEVFKEAKAKWGPHMAGYDFLSTETQRRLSIEEIWALWRSFKAKKKLDELAAAGKPLDLRALKADLDKIEKGLGSGEAGLRTLAAEDLSRIFDNLSVNVGQVSPSDARVFGDLLSRMTVLGARAPPDSQVRIQEGIKRFDESLYTQRENPNLTQLQALWSRLKPPPPPEVKDGAKLAGSEPPPGTLSVAAAMALLETRRVLMASGLPVDPIPPALVEKALETVYRHNVEARTQEMEKAARGLALTLPPGSPLRKSLSESIAALDRERDPAAAAALRKALLDKTAAADFQDQARLSLNTGLVAGLQKDPAAAQALWSHPGLLEKLERDPSGLTEEDWRLLGGKDSPAVKRALAELAQDQAAVELASKGLAAARGDLQKFRRESLPVTPAGTVLTLEELGMSSRDFQLDGGPVTVSRVVVQDYGEHGRGLMIETDRGRRFEAFDKSSIVEIRTIEGKERTVARFYAPDGSLRAVRDGDNTIEGEFDGAGRLVNGFQITGAGDRLDVKTDFDPAGQIAYQLLTKRGRDGAFEQVETRLTDGVVVSEQVVRGTGEAAVIMLTMNDPRTGLPVRHSIHGPKGSEIREFGADGSSTLTIYRKEDGVTQTLKVDPRGKAKIEEARLADGTRLRAISPNITEVIDPGGKSLGFQVDIHKEHAWTVAAEILKVMGVDDPTREFKGMLWAFIRDALEGEPKTFKSVRLVLRADGGLEMIKERADGTRVVDTAYFRESTPFNKEKFGRALVVTSTAKYDSLGKVLESDPRRQHEYLRRFLYCSHLTWGYDLEHTEKGGLGSDKKVYQWGVICWRDPGPNPAPETVPGYGGFEVKGEVKEDIPGTSALARLTKAFHNAPILGHAVEALGVVGKTVYTGIVGAGQFAISATGSETYEVEAAATYFKNPIMHAAVDEEDFVAGMSPGARNILDAEVRKMREYELRKQGITTQTTELSKYNDMMSAPITAKHRVQALKHFGAGSYGERIAAIGEEPGSGCVASVLTAVCGGAMTFAEGTAENLPLLLATAGLSRAAALDPAKFSGWAARGITLAGGAESVVTPFMTGMWVTGGADNALEFADALNSHDRAKAVRTGSQMVADFGFAAVAVQGARKASKQRAAIEERVRALGEAEAVRLTPEILAELERPVPVSQPEVKPVEKPVVNPNAPVALRGQAGERVARRGADSTEFLAEGGLSDLVVPMEPTKLGGTQAGLGRQNVETQITQLKGQAKSHIEDHIKKKTGEYQETDLFRDSLSGEMKPTPEALAKYMRENKFKVKFDKDGNPEGIEAWVDPSGRVWVTDMHHRTMIAYLAYLRDAVGVPAHLMPKVYVKIAKGNDFRGGGKTQADFYEALDAAGKGWFPEKQRALADLMKKVKAENPGFDDAQVRRQAIYELYETLPKTFADIKDVPIRSAMGTAFHENRINADFYKDYFQFDVGEWMYRKGWTLESVAQMLKDKGVKIDPAKPLETNPDVLFFIRGEILNNTAFNQIMKTRLRGPRDQVMREILENSRDLYRAERVLREQGGVPGDMFTAVETSVKTSVNNVDVYAADTAKIQKIVDYVAAQKARLLEGTRLGTEGMRRRGLPKETIEAFEKAAQKEIKILDAALENWRGRMDKAAELDGKAAGLK